MSHEKNDLPVVSCGWTKQMFRQYSAPCRTWECKCITGHQAKQHSKHWQCVGSVQQPGQTRRSVLQKKQRPHRSVHTGRCITCSTLGDTISHNSHYKTEERVVQHECSDLWSHEGLRWRPTAAELSVSHCTSETRKKHLSLLDTPPSGIVSWWGWWGWWWTQWSRSCTHPESWMFCYQHETQTSSVTACLIWGVIKGSEWFPCIYAGINISITFMLFVHRLCEKCTCFMA